MNRSGFRPVDASEAIRSRRTLIIWVTVFLTARVFVHWSQPILYENSFRQGQTALTALWMARDHFSLLRPPLPVFGPEGISVPFEFPTYQGIVALIAKPLRATTPESIAPIGRAVHFVGFL